MFTVIMFHAQKYAVVLNAVICVDNPTLLLLGLSTTAIGIHKWALPHTTKFVKF